MSAAAGAPTAARPGLDLRLLPAATVGWGAAAWAAPQPAAEVAVACAGAVLVAGAALGRLRCSSGRRVPAGGARRRLRAALLVPAVVAVLVLLSTAAQAVVARSGPLPGWAGERAAVRAEVLVRADPRRVPPQHPGGAERYAVPVRVEHVTGRGTRSAAAAPVLVLADRSWAQVRPGERYETSGRLAPVEPGDDVLALLLAQPRPQLVAPAGRVHRAAERLRAGLRSAAAVLPPDAGGLLPGLVVGDTSALPADLEEDMRAVGLAHLTAVSGSNTTLVCGAALLAAGAVGLGRRSRLVVAAGVLAGFVVLARPEPSVLRAAVMGGIGLLGLLAGRPGRGLPVLFGAAVLLLVLEPALARQYGFVLSCLATAALLLLAGPWTRWLVARGLPRWLAAAVSVPAAAQAACGPVAVLLTPAVNLLSVPVNVLVAPAVAPATVLGLAAAVVSPLWPGGAQLLARPAGVATGWIALVARTAAAAPTAVSVPPGGRGAVLVALGTAAGLALLAVAPAAVRARHRRTRRQDSATARGAPTRSRTALAVAAAALAVVVLARSAGWPVPGGAGRTWAGPDWLVVGCDVGQGDAVVLRSGPRSAVLVDTGPDPDRLDGCLDRLGVEVLDAVVLTHFHADHVDGLPGAGRGRRIGAVLVSPLRPAGPAASAVTAGAQEVGAPVRAVAAGERGREGMLSWWVLGPPAGAGGGATAGRDVEDSAVNDSSVVLLVEVSGVRVLLLGDVEPPAQRVLLAAAGGWPGGPAVDVVKVAHHGSAHQVPQLYAAVRPRVALVQAGRDNDYGHPAARTLDALAGTGARILRTDLAGDVAVVGGAQDLRTVQR